MKVLNLYSGIGGNRKLWGDDHDITAVELDPKIAAIYQDFFPKDKMIITDAHQYLLDHFKEYDFIWSSPPCPTHSSIRKVFINQNKPVYPDMKLYEEILLLQGYCNLREREQRWCVENVVGWYEPLIPPIKFMNHYFWTNFYMRVIDTNECREHLSGKDVLTAKKGFDISRYTGIEKIKTLRNCVVPETGKYIFDQLLLSLKKSELF